MAVQSAGVSFPHGIWREAALRYWQNAVLIAAIIVVLALVGLFGPVKVSYATSGITSVLWAFLAISVQNAILNKAPVWTLPVEVIGSWLWRALLLSIPAAAIGSGVLLALLYWLRFDAITVLSIMVPVAAVIEAVVFAAAGTWLSATVVDGSAQGIGAALDRGRVTFSYVLPRLLAGCGVCGGLALGVYLAGRRLLENPEPTVMEERGTDVGMIATSAVSNAVLAFAIIMLAIVLSRAHVLAQHEGAGRSSVS